jgi:uncharacterized membrane protein
MNWFWLTMIATTLWGFSYSLLRPIGPITPLVLQFFVGAVNVIYSMSMLYGINIHHTDVWIQSFTNIYDGKTIGLLFLYTLSNFFAGYCYFSATQIPEAPLSIIVALSSCYPSITLLILCLFYEEYLVLNLFYVVPGFIFTILGCTLLAFSKSF